MKFSFSYFLKPKWIAITLILIVLAGMIIYPKLTDAQDDVAQDKKTASSGRQKPLNVSYKVIRPEVISEKINITGSLIPDEEVELSFESSGKIVNIYFKEGTMVRKRELLAKMNDAPLQAQLQKLKAQLSLAENRVFRQKTLLEKDAVSQETFEQVTTDLEQLHADIDLIKSQIAQTELKAPFDGYIGLRMVSEGGYVSPATVISRLTKISPMKINFSVPERYAFQIQKGTKIRFRTDAGLTQTEATVYALEAIVDPKTRTRDVRAIFQNIKGEWMPGAFVSVEILLNEIPESVTIPSQALIPELGIAKVFLYKSGKAQPTEVITGLRSDANVQILSGLEIGDTLLTSGILTLRKGMEVTLNDN